MPDESKGQAPGETPGQALIDDFFDALRLRQLDRCQSALRSLQCLSGRQPSWGAWCTYLEGIWAFEALRDWAEAERTFAALLETDLDEAMRGRVQRALGRSLDAQGRWPEAIAAFERSARLYGTLGEPVEQAKDWKNAAISYCKGFTRGDYDHQALDRAATYCQQALDVLEGPPGMRERPPAPPPDVAWLAGSVWNTLGLVRRNLGLWDEALACYEHDYAICREQDDRHGMGLSLVNQGEVHHLRGRDGWAEALAAYQQALALLREFENRYDEIEALANLAFLYQEMGETGPALDHYLQAVDLVEILRPSVSDREARAGFFATVVDTYAHAVLLCLETGNPERAFDLVEQARARAFLDVLATGSLDLPRAVEAAPMTLAQVQAALPDDVLLFEYFTTGLVEARGPGGRRAARRQGVQRHRFPPAKTLVLAVTRDGIEAHDAGFSPNDLLPQRLDSVAERHFLDPQIRRTLYGGLIGPLEALLEGKRTLYLAPHGPLHYIPFQALLAADGEPLLRESGPELIYTPSATILLGRSYRASGRAIEPCLAIGYNGSGEKRLRYAEEEARTIARQAQGRALAGDAPKKDLLYRQAAGYRALHFSCHGQFDPQAPLASRLYLAPGETLTAAEVLEHLDLDCDLVTLSACESGLSRVRRGDELVGLTRAFLSAGALSLVSTLWRVDDRSTRILMVKLYQEMRSGASLAQALKRAQLYLRDLPGEEALVHLKGGDVGDGQEGPVRALDDERAFADPYYWAPFILVGDRERIKPV